MTKDDTSPFAVHGITHLSASSVNLFIEDPARWVMRYLFEPPSQQKPAFWRGTAVDSAIGRMFGMLENSTDPVSPDDCETLAVEQFLGLANYWTEQGYDIDETETGKELTTLTKCLETALPFYQGLGRPTDYQKEINLEIDGCGVPITGFLDLKYGEGSDAVVRDIKTTARKPQLRPSVARQLAIYAEAESAVPKVDYIYANSRASEVISYDVPDWPEHLNDVKRAVNAINNLLSYSDDRMSIASLVYPDYDKWSWSAVEIRYAKTIWG